jgi:prenyltransferase beta subunit
MADIFHTFFGIAGLSLLNYFHNDKNSLHSDNDSNSKDNNSNNNNSNNNFLDSNNSYNNFLDVDPTFALPKILVEKLGLVSSTLANV